MATVAILVAAFLAGVVAVREASSRRTIAALRQELEAVRLQNDYREQLAAVGQRLSGLAQELKGPLQGVIGNTELMLATTGVDAGTREELQDIQDNANRAAGIVRNLVAFGDAAPVARQWQDLSAVVAQAVDGCRAELQAAGVRVEVTRAERLPLVYVDGAQLGQVVATALRRTGASDAAAGRVVTVATHRRAGTDDRLTIEIADRSARAAGEPAWTGDLDASRRILDAHGGSISVEQPPAGGIRICIDVPVAASGS